MLSTLFRYIPKKSFSDIIIPKTQYTCCDLVYIETKETLHFGNVSKSNIERTYDSYYDNLYMIEIRNTITTKSDTLIYEKINISMDRNKDYDVNTNYLLSIFNVNIDNRKMKLNLEISNYKNQNNELDLSKYLNDDTYELYQFIKKEIQIKK